MPGFAAEQGLRRGVFLPHFHKYLKPNNKKMGLHDASPLKKIRGDLRVNL